MNNSETPDTLLQKWLAETPENIEEWLLQGLSIGLELLQLETGIVSQINNQQYTILQVSSKLGDIFNIGDQFELCDTYCSAVAREDKTITYIQVGTIPEMLLHPVYKAVQLESYIGAPIHNTADEVIGTLNFSSHLVRDDEFNKEEIKAIETMANKIATVLMTTEKDA